MRSQKCKLKKRKMSQENDRKDKYSILYNKPDSSVNASEGHRGYKRKSQLAKLEKLLAGVCAVLCGKRQNLPCLPKRRYPSVQIIKSKEKG